MQAGFLRLFGRRERDEKEKLPLEFSLRILLDPRMLSCSLNLLQSQIDGAASIAALLRSVKNAGWVVGEQNFLHTHREGGCRCFDDAASLSFEIHAAKYAQSVEAVATSSLRLLSLFFSLFGVVEIAPTSSCCALSRLPTAILICC